MLLRLPRMSRRTLLAAAVAAIVVALGAVPALAARAQRATPVPFGFVGVDVDYPVWPNGEVDLGQQLDKMVASGVDSVRAVLDWSDAQPYAKWSEVPSDERGQFVNVGGVPTNFTEIDALVAQTAQRGMTLLPIVIYAPPWDGVSFRGGQTAVPRTPGPYAAFVRALVLRYGRKGSFWRDNPQIPKLPVEMWEIWNEPDVYSFWPEDGIPWTKGYIPLLREAHAAVKGADPTAKVVLAGLANYSWLDLRRIVRHGGRGLFDMVDIHPFTKTPQGVITILSLARQVLNAAGLRHTPIVAGEVSWPSSQGQHPIRVGFDIGTTEAGQARRISQVLPMFARDRSSLGLAGFDYYNWASLDRAGAEVFDFAGLFHFNPSDFEFTAKPAAAAFQAGALALEGCSSKGGVATQCLH